MPMEGQPPESAVVMLVSATLPDEFPMANGVPGTRSGVGNGADGVAPAASWMR